MSDADAVEKFLVEDLGVIVKGGSIDHDQDLLAAGLIDSLGISETVVFIEERFEIEINDDELVPANFRSINAMAAFAQAKAA